MFSDAPPVLDRPRTPGEGLGLSSSIWGLHRDGGPLGHRDMSGPKKLRQVETPNTAGRRTHGQGGQVQALAQPYSDPHPRDHCLEGEITEASPGRPSIPSAPPAVGLPPVLTITASPGHPNQHLLLWAGRGGSDRSGKRGKGKKKNPNKPTKEEKSMHSFTLHRSRLILCPGDSASGWGNCCAGFSSRWRFPQTQLPFQARVR